MSGQNKVAAITTHILISNLAKSVVLLAVFVSISRILGSESLGLYSLALAITTPFFAFALLGIRILRITGPSKITTKVFETSLLLSGVVATIGSAVFSIVLFPMALAPVFFVSIYKWSDLFTELYAGELQHSHNTKKLLSISTIGSVFIAIGLVTSLLVSHKLLFSLGCLGALGILFAVILKIFIAADKRVKIRIHDLQIVLKLGIPLGLSGAVVALGSTIPQYRVAASLGESEVGLLAIFLYLYALADMFGAAYGQAWIPRMKSAESSDTLAKYSLAIGLKSSLALIPISVIGVYLFSLLAPVIFGAGITISIEQTIPLVIAITLMPFVHLVSTALFVRMHYVSSTITMVIATSVTAVTSFLFIPSLGITGGIYSVLFGLLTRGAFATFLLLRAIQKK